MKQRFVSITGCCCFFYISSLNTPPGTKVKLLGTVEIKNGLLLLDDSKISVLGGVVEHMVEKWELQRVSFHLCHRDSPAFICVEPLSDISSLPAESGQAQ